MDAHTPPRAVSVEVVAAQPTETDRAAMTSLRSAGQLGHTGGDAAYVVKVKLADMPPATGHGWTLFVDEERIPKYWGYAAGIYFKVFDAQFFVRHKNAKLHFEGDDGARFDTGLKLAAPPAAEESPARRKRGALPLQDDVLK